MHYRHTPYCHMYVKSQENIVFFFLPAAIVWFSWPPKMLAHKMTSLMSHSEKGLYTNTKGGFYIICLFIVPGIIGILHYNIFHNS